MNLEEEELVLPSGRRVRPKIMPHEDVLKIKDMLIPLDLSEIDPKDGKNLKEEIFRDQLDKMNDFSLLTEHDAIWIKNRGYIIKDNNIFCSVFTCKNFDTVERNCKIYEERPMMCRTYHCTSENKYKQCTLQPLAED